MEQIKDIIVNNKLQYEFLQGTFGLERESLRVHEDGRLALTDHPHALGSRSYHETISTDFSESQPELITPVCNSVDEMYRKMQALEKVLFMSLPQDEYIWTYSMPAILPDHEADIPIVRVEDQSQITYREGLAEVYGKRKQMISGMHFNFGFSRRLIQSLAELTDKATCEVSNLLHMELARNFIRYRWILTYLFGAVPNAHESFYDRASDRVDHDVRSIRSSPLGYHNELPKQVSYASIEDYIDDIYGMIEDGVLSQEREYYGSARPRGTEKIADLAEKGIQYVELRSIDNNPYASTGLSRDQLHFTHLFCLTMVWMELDDHSTEALELGTEMNEKTGLEDAGSPSQYHEEGLAILNHMQDMVTSLQLSKDYQSLVERAIHAFNHPEDTLSFQVAEDIKEAGSVIDFGMDLAKDLRAEYLAEPWLLTGYEQMEMSTQMVMFDALQKGINVEVVDEEDQFIRLEHDGREEFIQSGNKTSKDNYVSQLMMANKVVTKKVLADKGFVVPKDQTFTNIDQAKQMYDFFEGQAIVVKPKSTNYGLGITVFEEGPSQEDFEEALDIAFAEDEAVLIEEFVAGTEYRFFVIDGETKAVLLRVPANVLGDGEKTIRQLVEEKNEDPKRGEDHRAPLEKIELGQSELLTLKEQGLQPDDVPEDGQRVKLRTTSNISTGGDSIDFTEKMDSSYKEVAGAIGQALGAVITGVDLIIPDYQQASSTEAAGYTCLEANFNPAMHMHLYVHEGQGQRVTLDVIDLLYPELQVRKDLNVKE